MEGNRRTFFKATVAAASLSPRTVLGANDRIQVGIIGTGGRGSLMAEAFNKQSDCVIVAGCDVDKSRVDAFAAKAPAKVDTYGDYRRLLDRKDIDAVFVGTPDHWHVPITMAALDAGKDVYMEKPVSNTVPAAVKLLSATQKYKKIVQVGTMQRSGEHFQEAVKVIQNGGIGQVTQILVTHGTGGSLDRKPDSTPRPVPDGLDWEMWQGPAPRHPYTPGRVRSWRNWYDYGGGGVTDWGIHHIDIVHMALDPQGTKAPLFVAASCNYSGLKDPDRGAVPGTWAITFQYEDFVMVLQSCTPPTPDRLIQGPMFWGTRGLLLVNRGGYYVKPPSAYAGMMTTKFGRGAASRSAAEAKEVVHEDFQPLERGWEAAHVRNFLDCVKSRQKPLNDLETAFNGHLACLLASQSMKEGRALRWDPNTKTARPA